MPFIDPNKDKAYDLYTHMPLGHHPETHIPFLIPNLDRLAGIVINGLPGVGKSSQQRNMIDYDTHRGYAVILIEPHGDLTMECIAQLPDELLSKVFLLDMEDETHPFGLNLISSLAHKNAAALSQAIDIVTHVFEALWPDLMSQIYLPRYLRAAIIVLFANPGSTLLDMPKLLQDDKYRHTMLRSVKDESVQLFWQAYDELSPTERRQQVMPLVSRLESLFMGRELVRNIIGQESTIDFIEALWNRSIIIFKPPLKTQYQDARLIGILLIAAIHQAVFSFGNVPESQRPGVSIYVDEFSHFATKDFAELFSEGRKFGARLCLAHQYRKQLPDYLQHATLTAWTKICFRLTSEDARELAPEFANGQTMVKSEDIDPHAVEHLLTYGSDNHDVKVFIETYLRHLHLYRKGNMITVQRATDFVTVPDPVPYLNHLLYEAIKRGNDCLPIPSQVVWGFSGMGGGFHSAFRWTWNKGNLLSSTVTYPPYLVVEGPDGLPMWTRPPEDGKERLFHFIYYLRMTMVHLVDNPIGKKSTIHAGDIATMMTQLPKRWAFVRTGADIATIMTDDTPYMVDGAELQRRLSMIREQTRAKYCRPLTSPKIETLPPEQQPLSRWEEVE